MREAKQVLSKMFSCFYSQNVKIFVNFGYSPLNLETIETHGRRLITLEMVHSVTTEIIFRLIVTSDRRERETFPFRCIG